MVKRTRWFCLIILQGIEKLFCCIEIVLSQNFLWQILFFCPGHICPPLTTLWTQCFGSQSFNMTLSSWHQTSNSLTSLLVEYIKMQPGRPTQRWWAIYWFLQATWLLGLNSSGIMSSLNCWCIFSDNVQKTLKFLVTSCGLKQWSWSIFCVPLIYTVPCLLYLFPVNSILRRHVHASQDEPVK